MRAARSRTIAFKDSRFETASTLRRMRPSHNIDSPLISTRTAADSPTRVTSRRLGTARKSVARTRPETQRHTAVAISGLLGLTVPARKITIGVIATATPKTTTFERLALAAESNADARNAQQSSALRSRIR